MMKTMVTDRGGTLCAMDYRYCIDNGAMIAQAGVFAFQMNEVTPLKRATCTQRYRTDAQKITWREGEDESANSDSVDDENDDDMD